MEKDPDNDRYFTKHLFKVGLECPTKLFYKARDYPERLGAWPFIRHAIYNKRLLKALVRSMYPQGIYIEREETINGSDATTRHYLKQEEDVVLFDAICTHQQMMARLPVVIKNGSRLTTFHIQTKAFDARKHQLLNHKGQIHKRWRRYVLDFAYQLFILKQQYPDFTILPLLVLPDKTGTAQTDALPLLLKPLESGAVAESIPAANQQLLARLDVSEPLNQVWHDEAFAQKHLPKRSFAQSVAYLRDLYLGAEKVSPEIGQKCKRCEFNIEEERRKAGEKSGFECCWAPEQPDGIAEPQHVFDLIGPGTKQWIERGIYYQQEINESEIMSVDTICRDDKRITEKMRQALQIHKARGNAVPQEIIRTPLVKELRRWQYPLHFLDFEAGNYAVPIRRERPPYHLVVFQYSCHTLHRDGSWQHHQWIDDLSSGYPNYELVRQLRKVPDINEGTVVQYSNFERNALKIIRHELREEAELVPDSQWLLQWIEELIGRNDSQHPRPPYLADLSRQVRHFYYNSAMENSLSVKDVLQSVMSISPHLKKKYSRPYSSQNFSDIIWWQPGGQEGAQNPYDILNASAEDAIRRGTEAMNLYGKLIAGAMSKKEKQLARQALLRYCELDTLAMMMIVEHWMHKMNQLY